MRQVVNVSDIRPVNLRQNRGERPLMKISATVVKEFAKAVKAQNVNEKVVSPNGEDLDVYYIDDATVSFIKGEKVSLYGVSFETLGKEFTILATLELLVTLPAEEDDEGVYEIEDEELVAHMEQYLIWRANSLERFAI